MKDLSSTNLKVKQMSKSKVCGECGLVGTYFNQIHRFDKPKIKNKYEMDEVCDLCLNNIRAKNIEAKLNKEIKTAI